MCVSRYIFSIGILTFRRDTVREPIDGRFVCITPAVPSISKYHKRYPALFPQPSPSKHNQTSDIYSPDFPVPHLLTQPLHRPQLRTAPTLPGDVTNLAMLCVLCSRNCPPMGGPYQEHHHRPIFPPTVHSVNHGPPTRPYGSSPKPSPPSPKAKGKATHRTACSRLHPSSKQA